jgi:hypothetical protein
VEEVFLTAEAILMSVEAFIDIEAEDLTSLLDEAWNAEDDDAAAAAWLDSARVARVESLMCLGSTMIDVFERPPEVEEAASMAPAEDFEADDEASMTTPDFMRTA